MEWFVLIIPFLSIILLKVLVPHKVAWWELGLPLGISLILLLTMKLIFSHTGLKDTEYWGAPITKVEYYEPWNEWIEQTCSYTCCCDSKGNNCQTIYYDCSYVKHHSAYYKVTDAIGETTGVSKEEYLRLKKRFGGSEFVDLGRDYHTQDGDKYVATWNGEDASLELHVTKHTYENRVSKANSVFRFEDIDDDTKNKFQLYDYPNIYNGYMQSSILSKVKYPKAQWDSAVHNMKILNARLGPTQELKAFLFIYLDQPLEAGIKQEHYFKGGNKNEMIITIGVDTTGRPQWCYPISWTEKHDNEIVIRDWVMAQDTLNIVELTQVMNTELHDFKRKNFEDFSYLKVELTKGQLIIIFIVQILINIGAGMYVIFNEYDRGI